MLLLVTGLPGSGKTLNTIKLLEEDSRFKDRPIYYHRIKDIDHKKLERWHQIDKEQALKWYELPHGSIIVIDECQKLFPPRSHVKTAPRSVTELEEHRHKGFDLVYITQNPKLIDHNVRRLVGNHYHFVRPFGSKYITRREWQSCIDTPDERSCIRDGITKKIKLDQKYFGVYFSAETHTHKTRLPAKLFVYLTIPILCFSLLAYILLKQTTPAHADDQTQNNDQINIEEIKNQNTDQSLFDSFSPLNSLNKSGDNSDSLPDDPAAYTALFRPRVKDIPWSAPIYDELIKPQQIPIPSCIMSLRRQECRCYSQQGTRMNITPSTCVKYVENGFFNPFKKPEDRGSEQPQRQTASYDPQRDIDEYHTSRATHHIKRGSNRF